MCYSSHGSWSMSTDLLDVPERPTVVLTDHPLDPLTGVEPVSRHHVTEGLGQRLRSLQHHPSVHERAPGASGRRACDGEALFVFIRGQCDDLPGHWGKERGGEDAVGGFRDVVSGLLWIFLRRFVPMQTLVRSFTKKSFNPRFLWWVWRCVRSVLRHSDGGSGSGGSDGQVAAWSHGEPGGEGGRSPTGETFQKLLGLLQQGAEPSC